MTKRQSFPSYFKEQVKEGMTGAAKSIWKWIKGAAKVAWGVAKEIWRWAKAHVNWIKKAWSKDEANTWTWNWASAVTRKAMSRKALKTKK